MQYLPKPSYDHNSEETLSPLFVCGTICTAIRSTTVGAYDGVGLDEPTTILLAVRGRSAGAVGVRCDRDVIG